MRGFGRAFAALRGGWGDVFSGRLGWLAAVCLLVALGVTFGAVWTAFNELLPRIPRGTGAVGAMAEGARFMAGAGIIVLGIAFAPAISMITGGAMFDFAASNVERAIGVTAGRNIGPLEGFWHGLRIGIPALLLNLLALPTLFIPVVNIVVFLSLNGFLMGREYATLAAVRHMSFKEARALRRRAPLSVFIVGLVCSIVPFVAPLLGAGAMVRLVQTLRTEAPAPAV